jgi:DNA polymerase-3 subunit gamma/tau
MQLCTINSITINNGDNEKKKDLTKAEPSTSPQPLKGSTTTSQINNTPSLAVTTSATPIQVTNNPVETKVAESIVKKPFIKTSTPSINPLLNVQKSSEQNIQNTNETAAPSGGQPIEAFTRYDLETVWDAYANELKAKGKPNLATALLGKRPILVNETTIEFTVTNKALEETINEDKMNFLGFLRRGLKNYSVQLNLVMATADEKTNLYTSTDRYKHLADKNPAINKLRQSFDLDVEF